MTSDPLWISERDLTDLLSVEDAVDVLADVHGLYARGQALNMTRTHVEADRSNLHAVGGVVAVGGVAGTKTWIHTPGGASPLLVLFSPEDGSVLGVVEAFALGKLRTSATTALGTRVLAPNDADSLALVGTGKQSVAQAVAVDAVRPLASVRVFGRDPERREACARRLTEALPARVSAHGSLDEALEGAAVVTLVTRAAEPFLDAAHLTPGMHVNAVGAIMPSRREMDAAAVGRCDLVVVDSLDQARRDSGELQAAVDTGALDWSDVRELGTLLLEGAARPHDDAITLFKALGVGIADVALGAEVLRRARAAGLGSPVTGVGRSGAGTVNGDSKRRTSHV